MKVAARAQEEDDSNNTDGDSDEKDFGEAPVPRRLPSRRRSSQETDAGAFNLDNLNPISMGRRSRQVFDEVWFQLQRMGGPSRTIETVPLDLDLPEVFETPQAAETTVLVTGATGRVGRILVRKLLLRGYNVRALVRDRTGLDRDVSEVIPQSVEIVYGDVGDYGSCRKAMEGVDKVMCCSTARTSLTADLERVDVSGVSNLVKAFLDVRNAMARKQGTVSSSSKIDIADFRDEYYHPFWDVEHVGPPEDELNKKGFYAEKRRRAFSRAADAADAYINDNDDLVFEGAVYSRDGYADLGAVIQPKHDRGLVGSEGIVLRVLGDGQQYSLQVDTTSGATYTAKITTKQGYSTIRIPFNAFSALTDPDDAPVLEASEITHVRIRFEPRSTMLEQVTKPGENMYDNSGNRFHLEIDWIKALPGGNESDFVLVSCAGARSPNQGESAERDRVLAAKRRGEGALRNSGLGYTIVRPGPLAEEAGGYRALVFDQGNRITERISCADVADVCLKALHDPLARNKTFEVCWEYTPEEGLEQYELVAHLPDKANNYLSPALATLQRNT